MVLMVIFSIINRLWKIYDTSANYKHEIIWSPFTLDNMFCKYNNMHHLTLKHLKYITLKMKSKYKFIRKIRNIYTIIHFSILILHYKTLLSITIVFWENCQNGTKKQHSCPYSIKPSLSCPYSIIFFIIPKLTFL